MDLDAAADVALDGSGTDWQVAGNGNAETAEDDCYRYEVGYFIVIDSEGLWIDGAFYRRVL